MGRTRPLARRTQAERTAATRQALMDATLELLVEDGWTGMTTRSIAQRAGVSQGALQHHFPDRSELVAAALHHAAGVLAAEFVASPPAAGTERERMEAALDRLWQIHDLPAVTACIELVTAARTDPELAPHVARLLMAVTELVTGFAAGLAPGRAASGDLRGLVLAALAMMRGAAILKPLGVPETQPDWQIMKALLLTAWDALEPRR
ncbi:TetR/AcrR family transcriptional regulator [Actinocorallia lasiicapitis]